MHSGALLSVFARPCQSTSLVAVSAGCFLALCKAKRSEPLFGVRSPIEPPSELAQIEDIVRIECSG
jgi:hypothetical protein